MENSVRVRFAPSPTGALHIGGVRTALFNYLYAKKNNGKIILRIEDTDQSRYVEGAEEYIAEALKWSGIEFDEGPGIGGDFGPYRQSERKEIYSKFVQKLLDDGNAYYAFDTAEELDAMRERLKEAKVDNLQYNAISRMQMKNSITMSEDEVKAKLEAGDPYVVRLKVPLKEEVRLNDLVRGWVVVHSSAIDDKVLMKSDGMPTYHLANVVDDHLMKITHVIRGEEWLPSAPLHVLLYRFLGWEDTMPSFAHLPLIMKPEGQGKLSKRAGDKLGIPVFPIDGEFPDSEGNMEKYRGFRELGFLPEAFINFMAFLGWNPGGEKELYTVEELISEFDLEKIQKGGAKFDIEKANWFNEQYLRMKTNTELSQLLDNYCKLNSIDSKGLDLEKVIQLMKERISFINEIPQKASFLFQPPNEYDDKVIKKRWTEEAVDVIGALSEVLSNLDVFDAETIHSSLNEVLEAKGIQMGRVMQALRVSVTGLGSGPDLMLTMEILGKEEVVKRLTTALESLSDKVKQTQ